ncbi:hypothetical protein AZE42_07829 [Rhizopogon vesiculosus]|uniref:Uncharacterized protein n=1 Tax=Rhizopogon vesiculosus TaxID=180088 RepID=A0A1J8QA55_9AGAM|nr:hypothetical protein AZE42_07829 [Rhizopogon vesiculosus]
MRLLDNGTKAKMFTLHGNCLWRGEEARQIHS